MTAEGMQPSVASSARIWGAHFLARPWAPYLLALLIQLAIAPWFAHDWDGYVFLRSADDLLAGVSPYQVAENAPPHVYLDDHWPPLNTWYAYPPLELLLVAPFVGLARFFSSDPALLRLAVKMPFILGNLALAWVAGRLVARMTSEPHRARRVEMLLLFNPFLIFIASVWGMFDATMMAFLLASVLLLESRRFGAAGIFFGLATAVKVFPLFVAPVFAVYAWRIGAWRGARRLVTGAVATAVAIALPFFAFAPRGFLQQVFLMHFQRGPQGFALVSFPLQLQNLNNLFGWSIPIAPEAVVLAVASALLFTTLGLLTVLSARADDTTMLLRVSLAIFVGVLLVNKVVNEQYLVMPIVLFTILACLPRGHVRPQASRAYTWGSLGSSLLIGLHFLTFIPVDIAPPWLRPDEVVQAAAVALDLPVIVVFSIPHAIAIVLLVPALIESVRYVAGLARTACQDIMAAFTRTAQRVRWEPPTLLAPALLAIILIAPSVTAAILAAPPAPVHVEATGTRGLVLARYDLAIHNPSHDPAVRDGFWARGPYPEPTDGYYSATTRKVQLDLISLHAAGVDVILVGHSAGNRLHVDTFLAAAGTTGLRVAPVIDMAHLDHCPDAQRLRPSSVPAEGDAPDADAAHLASTCAVAALAPFRHAPAAFRVEGRPVLVALNASTPEWERALRPVVADAFVLAGAEPGAARASWADAHFIQPPQVATLDAFRTATRTALDHAEWPVASAFTTTWVVHDDVYATTWEDALAGNATWVIIPWNLHREGGGLEPLKGSSATGLEATKRFATRLQTL